jgi:hypothetical protein
MFTCFPLLFLQEFKMFLRLMASTLFFFNTRGFSSLEVVPDLVVCWRGLVVLDPGDVVVGGGEAALLDWDKEDLPLDTAESLSESSDLVMVRRMVGVLALGTLAFLSGPAGRALVEFCLDGGAFTLPVLYTAKEDRLEAAGEALLVLHGDFMRSRLICLASDKSASSVTRSFPLAAVTMLLRLFCLETAEGDFRRGATATDALPISSKLCDLPWVDATVVVAAEEEVTRLQLLSDRGLKRYPALRSADDTDCLVAAGATGAAAEAS